MVLESVFVEYYATTCNSFKHDKIHQFWMNCLRAPIIISLYTNIYRHVYFKASVSKFALFFFVLRESGSDNKGGGDTARGRSWGWGQRAKGSYIQLNTVIKFLSVGNPSQTVLKQSAHNICNYYW